MWEIKGERDPNVTDCFVQYLSKDNGGHEKQKPKVPHILYHA